MKSKLIRLEDKFSYRGILFKIAQVEQQVGSLRLWVKVREVQCPNDLYLPIKIRNEDSLGMIINKTIEFLNKYSYLTNQENLNILTMKVLKTFTYEGIEMRIVKRSEPYMNSGETVEVRRVMGPNGGVIPLQIGHRETLKSIQQRAIEMLEGFRANKGLEAVKEELTKDL